MTTPSDVHWRCLPLGADCGQDRNLLLLLCFPVRDGSFFMPREIQHRQQFDDRLLSLWQSSEVLTTALVGGSHGRAFSARPGKPLRRAEARNGTQRARDRTATLL